MKLIEFDFNPYKVHTVIKINNTVLPDNNIYNIIHSVQNFPIQCWLNKRGSWTGLMYKIETVSRGEDLQVVFRGRQIDYEDFHSVLHNYNWKQTVEIIHRTAYENQDYNFRLNEMRQLILRIWDTEYPAIYKGMIETVYKINDKIQQLQKPSNDMVYIETLREEEAKNILKRSSYGVVIDRKMLSSLEEMKIVLQASRSMTRTGDSIIMQVNDTELERLTPESLAELKNHLRLVRGEDKQNFEAVKELVFSKYSEPILFQSKISIIQEIIDNLIVILNQQEVLKKEISKLCLALNSKTTQIDPEDETEYDRMVNCLDWISKRKSKIDELKNKMNDVWRD